MLLDLQSIGAVESILETFLYRESAFHDLLCHIWEEMNS